MNKNIFVIMNDPDNYETDAKFAKEHNGTNIILEVDFQYDFEL